MATKGYNSYRGRGNVKKIIAAIALTLVILGAVGYLVVQNYIVYDNAGQAHLQLPNREKTDTALPEDEVNIEFVEPPEKWLPVSELHAQQLADGALKFDPAAVLKTAGEAMLIDVKRSNGGITYTTDVEVPAEVYVEKFDTMANLKTLLDDERYTVAHMYTLCDSYFVRAYHDAALLLESGSFWYDGDGWTWLDPTNPEVLGYVMDLCKEYAELGFDEILLDDFSYPMNGRIESIAIEEDLDKTAVLQSFAESLRNGLPEDVVLSIVIRSDSLEEIGLSAEMIADCFDRVYIAPGVDAAALLRELPEEYDRNTRVVQMVYQKPQSGSYVLLTQ